jgi:hypothetical protein
MTGLFAKVGQVIFVEGGGYYEVVSSTTTTIELENLGYTGNASPTSTVSFPAGVSPGGVAGAAGAAGANGSAGANGVSLLFKRLTGSLQASTSYVNLLAGTNGITANRWQNVGDTVRLSFLGIGVANAASTLPIINGAAGNRMEFDFRVTVGGVTCATILGGAYNPALSSVVGSNGLDAVIDLIAVNMSPFTLAVHFKKISIGSAVSGGSSYLVGSIAGFPLTANFQTGDPSATITGIDPTTTNLVEIQGRHTVIGTGGGASGQVAVPYAMAELFKIQ